MPQKVEKKAFVFRASNLDIIENFSEDRRGKIVMALIEYGLSDNLDDDSILFSSLELEERTALAPVKDSISIQKKRYTNRKMIKGAIKIVKEQIIETMDSAPDNNSIALEKYEKTIELLEEKLDEIKNYNIDILPQEVELMLPKDLRKKFNARFVMKTWEEQFKDIIEKWILGKSQMYEWVTPDIKEQVYKDMIVDFSKMVI